jgi:hypothetical protein
MALANRQQLSSSVHQDTAPRIWETLSPESKAQLLSTASG